jgi:hypothetical protein
MPGDIDGLDKLQAFDISHNPIEEIPRDFFKGKITIEKLSFHDCHLRKVAPNVFKDMQLSMIDVMNNFCIQGKITSASSISFYAPSFIENIYDKCTGSGYVPKELLLPGKCENEPEKLVYERRSKMFTKIGIVLILFLITIASILSVTLWKIYKNDFKGNFTALKSTVMAFDR